ncbi:hypothetical protein ACFPT7_10745 [Acidicapsa dinghuensis]|uniref:Uncharacterized protein n=1 Tax=Acidicapsa dinghuensis TaxID=2218256 RepID=A0ABW1EFL8_9BACT|nr:hypothetical protein [Acidicapsa dinghuensis]
MSTTPVNPGGSGAAAGNVDAITYPLSPAVRKAYEDLYESTKKSFEQTNDTLTIKELGDIELWIGNVLSADDEARIAQDDASFTALKKTVADANAGLKKVQGDMENVAKKIGVIANVVAGITAVLSFFPTI